MKIDHTKPYAVWSDDSRHSKCPYTGRTYRCRDSFLVLYVPGERPLICYNVEHEDSSGETLHAACEMLNIPIAETYRSRAFTLDVQRFLNRYHFGITDTNEFTL